MNHIAIPIKNRFYGALQKTAEVFKLYSQIRYLSKETKDRMRRAILSSEETNLLESIGSLTKGTPKTNQHKTVGPVQKQNPCILGINRPWPDQRKSFTSTCATFQATARLPSLRVSDAIKRSYLWGQRMNALKSREKSLGKIDLTPNNDSAAADTNIREVVIANQETKVLAAIHSITKGTSKVSQAKTTEPMGKNVPCILQFNRSSTDPPNRFISSRTSEGQHRGFPQLRGADEIKRSYLKRQFMNMHRSRGKVPKAEPLTPDNDPMKSGKWR